MYPFPMLRVGNNSTSALTTLLPPPAEVLENAHFLQRRVQLCLFPLVLEDVTKRIEYFLDDTERNATSMPDMLALVFAIQATGIQMNAFNHGNFHKQEGQLANPRGRSECYGDSLSFVRAMTTITDPCAVAASMQALRNASFMNEPTLLGVQTLLVLGPYLSNSGRALDAWTLFGMTIRLAQSIGLHRNPRSLDPVPSARECMFRSALAEDAVHGPAVFHCAWQATRYIWN